MLRRVIYENWQLIFPVTALAVATAIYAFGFARACLMRPARVERLARLPFDS